MRRKHSLWLAAVLIGLATSNPVQVLAKKVGVEGRAWLDAQKDPAVINVNGTWDSDEWGAVHLRQSEGSRDVSGSVGGYEITGVVSGNRLFMLFSAGDYIEYCAVLSPDGNNMMGTYSNRKRGKGVCQEDKSRPMYMTKK